MTYRTRTEDPRDKIREYEGTGTELGKIRVKQLLEQASLPELGLTRDMSETAYSAKWAAPELLASRGYTRLGAVYVGKSHAKPTQSGRWSLARTDDHGSNNKSNYGLLCLVPDRGGPWKAIALVEGPAKDIRHIGPEHELTDAIVKALQEL